VLVLTIFNTSIIAAASSLETLPMIVLLRSIVAIDFHFTKQKNIVRTSFTSAVETGIFLK
jgi:hypothetical protein